MFDKNNIPDLYKKMYDRGYLSWNAPDRSKYISMDDMEWMEYEKVMNYRCEAGEMDTLLPFAFTGGGDKWTFVDNGSKEPFIALCEHDTGYGVSIRMKNRSGTISKSTAIPLKICCTRTTWTLSPVCPNCLSKGWRITEMYGIRFYPVKKRKQ